MSFRPFPAGFRAKGKRKQYKPGVANKTELRYMDHLKARQIAGEVVWWEFEPVTLKLADGLRYTPDFAVLPANTFELEFHEVKAGIKQKTRDGTKQLTGKIEPYFSDEGAKPKLKVAADKFPFTFFVCWEEGAGNWKMREF